MSNEPKTNNAIEANSFDEELEKAVNDSEEAAEFSDPPTGGAGGGAAIGLSDPPTGGAGGGKRSGNENTEA